MKLKYLEEDVKYMACKAIDFMKFYDLLDEKYINHYVIKYETFNSEHTFLLMVKAIFIPDTTKLEPLTT